MAKKPVGKNSIKLSKDTMHLLKTLNNWRRYPNEYNSDTETANVLADINDSLTNIILWNGRKTFKPFEKARSHPLDKLYRRIDEHANEMIFQLNSKRGWRATSGKTVAAYWWAKVSSFYSDLARKGNPWKNTRRLHECTNCQSLFWGSLNAGYCRDRKCVLAQIKNNTARFRRGESKPRKSKQRR